MLQTIKKTIWAQINIVMNGIHELSLMAAKFGYAQGTESFKTEALITRHKFGTLIQVTIDLKER